jgi:hypothetical protein
LIDLDKHRGLASLKATDLGRALAEEAAVKARICSTSMRQVWLPRTRDTSALVAALFDDFARLSGKC